jgi:hypothetical protein
MASGRPRLRRLNPAGRRAAIGPGARIRAALNHPNRTGGTRYARYSSLGSGKADWLRIACSARQFAACTTSRQEVPSRPGGGERTSLSCGGDGVRLRPAERRHAAAVLFRQLGTACLQLSGRLDLWTARSSQRVPGARGSSRRCAATQCLPRRRGSSSVKPGWASQSARTAIPG